MQTFLPWASFTLTARCLDRMRLGKQRVETLQILRALLGLSRGWVNHPATRMWRGHGFILQRYGIIMCEEWLRRGYRDSTLEKIKALQFPNTGYPDWYYDNRLGLVIQSHREMLCFKSVHYHQFGWKVEKRSGYYWPV